MKIATRSVGIIALAAIIGLAMAGCKDPKDGDIGINAQIPNITAQPVGTTVNANASHSLFVVANVNDGGTLSYRWYSNTGASNTGGIAINGATSDSYAPPTGTSGAYYYFVEVTNVIPYNGDGGNKTATIRSNVVEIQVISPSGVEITLSDMDEWELTEQAVQASANLNKVFSVAGTYTAYKWYLDGVLVGTSPTYTFNKPVNNYQLAVVVTNSNGESRSGRCRITVN